jgi:hypothetical protein
MKNWKDIAKDLPLNGKVQTLCPENCGSGEKLSVTHSMKSYWCNCYRCGFTDIEYKGKQSLAELTRIQELNKAAESIELTLDLPKDFTNDLPLHARMWLFKAGITEPVYRSHNIGYSERLDRVVLPVYDAQDNLIWYQCRALQAGQKPKYLQPARDRSKVMFHVTLCREDVQRVIVVEDILSAIRVGRHINTVSLLGTKITTAQAAHLGQYSEVTTWLDADRAGRQGAYKIRKTLSLLTTVSNILTPLDPKELSDKDIRSQLNV